MTLPNTELETGGLLGTVGPDSPAMRSVLMALDVLGLRAKRFTGLETTMSTVSAEPSPLAAWLLVDVSDTFECLRDIRRAHGSVPIHVVLSIEKSQADATEVAILQGGGDGFSAASDLGVAFLARVSALLRRGSGVYRIPRHPRLRIDRATQLLLVDDRVIPLSRSEFAVVDYLHARARTWVSKDELFRELFGVPRGYDSSLLRTHIHNARKKLGAAAWVICTDRERGVLLIA